jgi:hypothetical protein
MGRRCTKITLRFFGAESWCRRYRDLRLRTDINRRPDVTAQVAVLRKHGAGKVVREVASGAKTDRPQLRRLLDPARRRRRGDGDAARPAGAIHPRRVEHARDHHRQASRFQIPLQHGISTMRRATRAA